MPVVVHDPLVPTDETVALLGDGILRAAVMPAGLESPWRYYFLEMGAFAPNADPRHVPLDDGGSLVLVDKLDVDERPEEATLSAEAVRAALAPSTRVLVWRWEDAPSRSHAAGHGGDEDWVALVPHRVEAPAWLEAGSVFGCSGVNVLETVEGIYHVGAHA